MILFTKADFSGVKSFFIYVIVIVIYSTPFAATFGPIVLACPGPRSAMGHNYVPVAPPLRGRVRFESRLGVLVSCNQFKLTFTFKLNNWPQLPYVQ